MTFDLARGQRIHFIGIGGSGLSAIARLLLESGYRVSGSDRSLSPLAQELASAGAQVFSGHRAENTAGADLVIRSSAVPDDNIEVQSALAAGIPVLKRSQFMGALLQNHYGIAIAGTHGKTTITAMTSWLLASLDLDPSFIIGGTARNLDGKNAHAGQGRAFVIEADEYDRMFLGLHPDLAVVSYLEHDHPDCFPTPQDYFEAFAQFASQVRPGGVLLLSMDSNEAMRLQKAAPAGVRVLTYGTHPQAAYTARGLTVNSNGGFDFEAWYQPQDSGPTSLGWISLQVPGEHNVRNSLAALAAVHQSGLVEIGPAVLKKAAQALGAYTGTGRRFEVVGEAGGVTLIDDYAHHPTEIRATLSAARTRFAGRRIWAVWQPHTYSRTLALEKEFMHAFGDADRVIVTEVYAAREQASDFGFYSSARLVEKMNPSTVQWTASLEDTSAYLLRQLDHGDVVLVLSAGDADQVNTAVLSALKERAV